MWVTLAACLGYLKDVSPIKKKTGTQEFPDWAAGWRVQPLDE